MDTAKLPKIFQIGFNKCGTRTLMTFFQRNGLPSVHWDRNRLALAIGRRMRKGQDPLADYPRIVAFGDMECIETRGIKPFEAYREFAYLHRWYPDAYFILNTRDVERWLVSRSRHRGGNYLATYKRLYGLASGDEVRARWRAEWESHHHAVRSHFAGNPRYLEFDIAEDSPVRLVEHLSAYPLDPAHYGHIGKSGEP